MGGPRRLDQAVSGTGRHRWSSRRTAARQPFREGASLCRRPRKGQKGQALGVSRGGCFSPCLSRGPDAIGRMACHLKDCRRIAVRHDKRVTNFLAAGQTATLRSYRLGGPTTGRAQAGASQHPPARRSPKPKLSGEIGAKEETKFFSAAAARVKPERAAGCRWPARPGCSAGGSGGG